MKKSNPFAKSKAKVVGSFVQAEEDSSSTSKTSGSNNKKQIGDSLSSSSTGSKKRSSSLEEEFTSYPLSKKKLVNPASTGPNQPNVERTAESSMRASLQMTSNIDRSDDTTYLKPLPAGFFDVAPSDKDLKNIRDGYKELNKSDELFKDKGFAQLVKSSVVKKSIDKKNKESLPVKPSKAERSIQVLEKEQDEREDTEEMKRQLEEFLKIEELKKQKEMLKGKSTTTNITESKSVENSEQSESSDDELVIDWKKRGR